jgi:hypothetical protein
MEPMSRLGLRDPRVSTQEAVAGRTEIDDDLSVASVRDATGKGCCAAAGCGRVQRLLQPEVPAGEVVIL